MVAIVQKRRGPHGYDPRFKHLPWPSDVTEEQKLLWRKEYIAMNSDNDIMGRRCKKCERGLYIEASVVDDINGVLHCSQCKYQVNRYEKGNEVLLDNFLKDKFPSQKESPVQEDQWNESVRGQKMSNPTGYTVFKYQIPVLERFIFRLEDEYGMTLEEIEDAIQ